MSEPKAKLSFENLPTTPAFASINRDYSFYGTFSDESANVETLVIQAKTDPNAYCRVNAMRVLTDMERKRLLLGETSEVDPLWLGLYGEILADVSLPSALRAFFLRIDEQPMDRKYCAWFPELVAARRHLMSSVHNLYSRQLLEQFENLDTYSLWSSRTLLEGIEDRQLKSVLLDLIAAKDTTESHRTILDHFRRATTANDRVSALVALNRCSAPERLELLEEAYGQWHSSITGYANYLRAIGSGTCPDVFEQIEKERARPTFLITQPTWFRALFLTMANNNKIIWNERGINRIADLVIEIAPANYMNASRMLNTFQYVRKMKPDLQALVLAALERIVGNVSDHTCPAVHRQARAYLTE